MAKITKGSLFPRELESELFSLVKGKSSLARLSGAEPLPFVGKDIFTFNFSNKLSIVGLNNVLAPMAFIGPNFAFLAHESRQERWDNRSVVTSFDLGFGVELLRHLQLSACYSMGLNRALKQVGLKGNEQDIDGRDRTWTIAAAYLF